MRSRQISFFLSGNDHRYLFERILLKTKAILLKERFSELESPIDDTFIGNGNFICYSTSNSMIENVEFTEIEGTGKYRPNLLRSPIIEFMKSRTVDHAIFPGRIYFTKSFLQLDGNHILKDRDFLLWADNVIFIAKKHLKSIGGGYYLGVEAESLLDKGYRLEK